MSHDRLASFVVIAIFATGPASAALPGETAAVGAAAGTTAASGTTAETGDTTAAPVSGKPPLRASGHVRVGGSLQHRVDVLSKGLQLDARQRTLLMTLLEGQRQAIAKIWSDPNLLPAERTPATRAVEERTADQIRGLLTEEQQKRYNPPKPAGAQPPAPDVEDWMRKQSRTQALQPQSSDKQPQ